MSEERARDLALALPAVTERPDGNRVAFRTARKTFATLDATGVDLISLFDQLAAPTTKSR